MRTVLQYTKGGELVGTFPSLAAAAAAVGKSASNIGNCCNGKHVKSAYGYVWKYGDGQEDDAEEEWRPFQDCFVSSKGRLKRPGATGYRIMTASDMGRVGNYPTVMINGTSWRFHRLVAKVFLGFDETSGLNVSFADGDASNARPGNLVVGGGSCSDTERDATTFDDDYIAGMFDGDGSIVMSLVGTAACKSVQLKVELTQCDQAFLRGIRARLGAGVIYKDTRVGKYRKEAAACLRLVGAHARPLLDIVSRRGIIKAPQARLALEFLALPRGACDDKKVMRERMRGLNADKAAYAKDYSRLTDAYVAGLFDAEGNVYHFGTKMYVKITQKSDPQLLHAIAAHLGYGSLSEQYRFKLYSHADVLAFWRATAPHLRIKKPALHALASALLEKQRVPLEKS